MNILSDSVEVLESIVNNPKNAIIHSKMFTKPDIEMGFSRIGETSLLAFELDYRLKLEFDANANFILRLGYKAVYDTREQTPTENEKSELLKRCFKKIENSIMLEFKTHQIEMLMDLPKLKVSAGEFLPVLNNILLGILPPKKA